MLIITPVFSKVQCPWHWSVPDNRTFESIQPSYFLYKYPDVYLNLFLRNCSFFGEYFPYVYGNGL